MCGSANNAESAVRTLFPFAAVVACLLLAPAVSAQTRTWTEPLLIERLNQAADRFKTLTATLQYTKFTQVVDDKSTESGRLTYSENRRILIEMLNPEPKEILFTGSKAYLYYPKMAQIQEFDLDKHRSLVEQFLLLGFGTSGDKLRDSYLITVLGEAKLDNRAVLQVELTPKDERIRQQIHKIHLWLDLASWLPVQQKFFEVGGDYLMAQYSDIKVNVPIPVAKQRLSAPRGTKTVKPRANL